MLTSYTKAEEDTFHNEERTYRNFTEKLLVAIEKKVDDGFDGVHKRQDTTNGNVQELKEWKSFTKGALAVITTLIIPILIYIVTNLLK